MRISPVYTLFYNSVYYYHCRSAMICRDDLELRWRLLMCENEFSYISLLLYISTAFSLSLRESEVRALVGSL